MEHSKVGKEIVTVSDENKNAKNRKMLTQDDFMKGYIKKELEDRRIDISDDKYYMKEEFKELEREYVYCEIFVPKSWWVEKYLVGQERLRNIYGIYAMGVEHEFSKEELKNSVWMSILADKYSEAKINAEEFIRTTKDIEQYFFRKETNGSLGLVERLKKIGFDISLFSSSDAEKEKVKLLYFLFCFEFDNKVKLYSFLKNPTLENIDNICAGDKTVNGKLMASLKNNLLKEVDWRYIRELKDYLEYIIVQWEIQIINIRYIAYESKDLDFLKDINNDLEWLLSLLNESSVIYIDSLLETFYLKLSLHEMLGREEDLLDVFNRYSDGIPEADEYFWKKYCKLPDPNSGIGWDCQTKRYDAILNYINRNRKIVAQCVFSKEDIKSNDYKKLDGAVQRLKAFIDFLDLNTKFGLLKCISPLLLISCLQEFIFINKSEKVSNKFFRYQGKDVKTLNSELYHGQEAFRKNQIAWVVRVMRRYDANCGNGEVNAIVNKIECSLDLLLNYFYKSNSLYEMMKKGKIIFLYIKIFIEKRDIVLDRCNELICEATGKKWCLSAIEERFFRIFLGTLDNCQFRCFVNQIIDWISIADEQSNDKELVYHYDIKQEGVMEDQMKGFFEIKVRSKEKEIKFGQWGIEDL